MAKQDETINIKELLEKYAVDKTKKRFEIKDLEYNFSVKTKGKWYESGEYDEQKVNDLFNRYNDLMYHREKVEKLDDVISDILHWGGISNADGLVDLYTKRLQCWINDKDKVAPTSWDAIMENFQTEGERRKRPQLASWSKVLAAYTFKLGDEDKHKKFFIYDSRVAIALNIIDEDHYWFLPEGRGNKIVPAFIKKSKPKNNTYDAKKSYQCYCESLRKNGGVTLERQLFMLGGYLDFKMPEWRDCIFVNPQKKEDANNEEQE